jgi:hypothetical protein
VPGVPNTVCAGDGLGHILHAAKIALHVNLSPRTLQARLVYKTLWAWTCSICTKPSEIQSSNNSNDCLKSGGLCFPKLRPIQYESPAKRRRQIKEYNAGICQRDITWILRNFYQVMPGMRWGGSFKNRTWLSETLCL